MLQQISAIDPDVPIMIITGFGTVETAVEAMKLGAFDFLTKPIQPEVVRLKVERALELCRRAPGAPQGRRPQRVPARRDRRPVPRAGRRRRQDGDRAAHRREGRRERHRRCSSPARAAPARSWSRARSTGCRKRANGPFIKVNCGALTETLLESELFGHEKGAFTGAIKQKLGRFELADGGTLFLDEIGDVPPAMQVKLLRALQEQEFERVGGEAPIKVDVRVVSATNKDLEAEVAAGPVPRGPVLPPARRAREAAAAARAPRGHPAAGRSTSSRSWARAPTRGSAAIGDAALGRLMAYHWPGNVRELENAIEQALVFAEGDEISAGALPQFLQGGDDEDAPRRAARDVAARDPRRSRAPAHPQGLRARPGRVKTETARLLGIKTSALYYKLEKYGIQ